MKRISIALIAACVSLAVLPALALNPVDLDPILMAGNVAFFRKAATVNLSCGQIASYRPSTILSGTLVFQLMAATSPTSTPSQAQFKLCEVQIGKLQGHQYIQNVQRTATFRAPAPGTYYVIFVLAEWDGTKYVPIDWHTFSNPKTFSSTTRFQAAAERIPGT